MTDQQSQLLALPSRYHNLQQPQEVFEELPVDLHPLPDGSFAVARDGSWAQTDLRLVNGGGFLLRYSITYPVYEGNKEGEVDCAGYIGPVLEIEIC